VKFPPATHLVAHCDSEDQARALRDSIADRLGALGLELHPEKTKVVFCQDANRPGPRSTPASTSSAIPSEDVWPVAGEASS